MGGQWSPDGSYRRKYNDWLEAFDILTRDRVGPGPMIAKTRGYFRFYGVLAWLWGILVSFAEGLTWWAVIPVSSMVAVAFYGGLIAAASVLGWTHLHAVRRVPFIRNAWANSSEHFRAQRGHGLWPALGAAASIFFSREAWVPVSQASFVVAVCVVGLATEPVSLGSIGTAAEASWVGTVLLATCAALVGPTLMQSAKAGAARITRPSGGLHGWSVLILTAVVTAASLGALLVKSGPLSTLEADERGLLALCALVLFVVIVVAGVASVADIGLARVRSRGVPRRYVVDGPPSHRPIAKPGDDDATLRPLRARVVHDDPLDPKTYERRFIVGPGAVFEPGVRPLRRSLGAADPVDYCWGHECAGGAALAADLARDALDDFHVPQAVRDAVMQLVVAPADPLVPFECRTADLEMAMAFAGGSRRPLGTSENRLPPRDGGW